MSAFRKKFIQVAVAALFVVGVWATWLIRSPLPWERSGSQAHGNGDPSRSGSWLTARENAADQTVWAKEITAQTCGGVFESFWDSINAATNKLSIVAEFAANEFVLAKYGAAKILPHKIELREPASPGTILTANQWPHWIETFIGEGWRLDSIEFRHNRFETDKAGQPRQSDFYFAARLSNPGQTNRAVLEGTLVVQWNPEHSGEQPLIKRVDASQIRIKSLSGEPFFQPMMNERFTPEKRVPFIDPLIIYDLDGDGLSEIILAAKNLVYRRHPDGHYEPTPLCRYPPDSITTAIIADFDGDGSADFLCANAKGLLLFKGSPQGTFDEPGRLVWAPNSPLKNAMVLTCGDIDQDGDLDVFLGQYKIPTLGQVIRPYYYDANDSFPSSLLLNDGHGNFSEVTESAGLGRKRGRRIYSASFADLDSDGFPDLLTVSDFAGLDLYRNDGHGHFTDVTSQWIPEAHGFGMAHALADFNADGRLDLLMIGMPSPTVDRLEHLELWRGYSADDRQRRSAMASGNRLLLGQPGGGFEQTTLNASIARSGWSWGCSAFDFDNDGFPDVYIANGLESKQSVRDYEREFWLHDIFIDEKVDDVSATKYLMDKMNRTRGAGWSYGGYEKNRLYLNQGGESFIEIGHLAGLALEQDSRNVVADDLDGDGRVDLVVTTFEVWPQVKQTLQVYNNAISDSGHWIGFRFREQTGHQSPVGARVTIHYQNHDAIRQIVTGDSHRSQHANTVHFGLGAAERVDLVEIRWPTGQAITMREPSVDSYHAIEGPAVK